MSLLMFKGKTPRYMVVLQNRKYVFKPGAAVDVPDEIVRKLKSCEDRKGRLLFEELRGSSGNTEKRESNMTPTSLGSAEEAPPSKGSKTPKGNLL